jgi:prophage tail gpP-like protein
MDDSLTLIVGGERHGGWTDVEVALSLEQVAGGFAISLTEKWLDGSGGFKVRPVDPGAACRVELGGEVLIDGHVDTSSARFDRSGHTVLIQGRDRTADLVDSSAVHDPDEWRGETLEQIVRRLAAPFGVKVTAKADTGEPFEDPNPFKIQQGETAFDAIDRACRLRAVLAVPDGKGGLLLTRGDPEGEAEALIEGKNIEAVDRTLDNASRFSRYIVKGQSAGSDDFNGDDAAGPQAESTDSGITRDRPLMVMAEVAAADLQKRADWEANIRAARAESVRVTVAGWRQGDGTVWRFNRTASVDVPSLGINATLLIVGTRFTKDPESGTHTTLLLMPKEAFQPAPPEVEEAAAGDDAGGFY